MNIKNFIKTTSIANIIIPIIVFAILVVYLVLYNISFKYNQNDYFFKMLIIRSEQLDDKIVSEKIIKSLNKISFAINDPEIRENNFKHIYRTKDLNTNYVSENILNHIYPSNIYKNNKFLIKSVKTLGLAKICIKEKCFANKYTNLYGKNFNEINDKSFVKIITPGGIPYAIKITSKNCKNKVGIYGYNCGYGYVDINGKKGPNKLGVDLFDFGIFHIPRNEIVVGVYYQGQIVNEKCFNGEGYGCTSIAVEGVRPYLVYSANPYNSKYIFKERIIDYIYLTPKGKLVFFNSGGFADFVTPKTILKRINNIKKSIIEPKIKNLIHNNKKAV